MNKIPRLNLRNTLAPVTHALFIAGLVILFLSSNTSGKPIHLDSSTLYKSIAIYALGYFSVFVQWLRTIKSDEPYAGLADDVPAYLTQKLWGEYPYLGTFGRSNKSNQRPSNIKAHTYQDIDVIGKCFRDIYILHLNKFAILLLALVCILLPYMLTNQAAPSFLYFIFNSSLLFTIYMSFLIIGWLSSSALLTLRIILWLQYRHQI
ncbi:hypothetical protein EZJ19_05845 [Parasulfuritortus cantonensis]|uniref:Uncharacterized protein n=1 Tax=Parasulfuritortus cantonensis TaxID=2528202 RepID=A0A4R1BFN5_9PROT|nr:hypothetical protein [Parasulfuritortus cantonensis]TCJ15980.1 hypothetical protein EZJ19_05845 [Parasulfuritortus cantonensis]